MLRGGGQPLERALASVAILRSQVAPDWRSRRFTISWVGAAAVFVSLIALVPIGFVGSATLETGWIDTAALVWRPRVGELLINTALLMIIRRPSALCWASGWRS
jgi:hypothetical protein